VYRFFIENLSFSLILLNIFYRDVRYRKEAISFAILFILEKII